jgi:hypothetical protein
LCFQRLFAAASRLEDKTSPWLPKYAVVADSLQVAFTIGDAKKNAQRISSDFYLSSFHLSESFNLENIFYDFPRLSAILSTDCIPLEVKLDNLQCNRILSKYVTQSLKNHPLYFSSILAS